MKFSVIIPAFNVEKLISQCLKSILNQGISSKEYEIIIVDDGSTDKTVKVIISILKTQKNIILLRQENQKQGTARNNALKIAKGEYIWFVDSDDYIEKNSLLKLYKIAKKKNLDLLCFNNYIVKNDQIISITSPLKKLEYDKIYRGKDFINSKEIYCGPCFCIYKREFLLKNQIWFKEKLTYEDNEFMLRVYYYANRVSHINFPLYYVLLTDTSTTRSPSKAPIFDLIKIAKHMMDFCDEIHSKDFTKKNCYFYTVLTFNTAIYKLRLQSKETRKDFISSTRYLKMRIILAMFKSHNPKYALEGIIFSISPSLLLFFSRWIR